MFNKINRKTGFTLIELLVVISIIGLLSSVVLASLNTSRAKARDSKRIAQLKQVQTALELYYSKYGTYPDLVTPPIIGYARSGSPDDLGNGCGPTTVGGTYPNGVWCDFESKLTEFIKPVPKDLNNSTYKFHYKFNNSNKVPGFGLGVELETTNSVALNDGGYHDNMYETGTYPRYCKTTYPSGSDGNWNSWNGSNVCDDQGGN